MRRWMGREPDRALLRRFAGPAGLRGQDKGEKKAWTAREGSMERIGNE